MKVRIVLSLAAIIAGLASARSTINYNDVVAKGYRWVTVDGPYACVSKDDLRQIIKSRNTGTELEMIKQQRAYYLLQGDIVKVVREDVTSGLALIRMAGIPKELWTQTKFLSKRPVENAFGVVETPETSGLILSGLTSITDSAEPSGATPATSTKQTPAKTLEISPKPNFARALSRIDAAIIELGKSSDQDLESKNRPGGKLPLVVPSLSIVQFVHSLYSVGADSLPSRC